LSLHVHTNVYIVVYIYTSMAKITATTRTILLDIVNKIDIRKNELMVQQTVCIKHGMDLEEKMVFRKMSEINEIRDYIVMEYLRQ
jgi:hypothetical protein